MAIRAVLIAGPTASGKSRAALALAQAVGGTVINTDSMQVYREARILTARPSDADMARAPHLLYGHVGVREAYSVGRFQADALQALEKTRGTAIFAGGTGLYFAALTEGLTDIPPVPMQVRAAARARLEEIGVAALHAELAARDPATAAGLRASDPQRVLRAYEVFEATGRPLAHWQEAKGKPVLGDLPVAKFVLDLPRPELRARIDTRFRAMLDEGALEEAKALEGLDPALPAAKILGLRELSALRHGRLGGEEAIQKAVTATRQFAKRQSTWFRNRMADWNWVASGSDLAALL
ncbi:MAG TPA: tRNA (adenosine(37)-N6)-dimethylallyltransferase MiaA [Rhizomicrobium sp.]|jgi:tRNA dimethylallyltransferase|nr:tRNA (adenosine(37)-N6)-dimethylallyltransferase MiaA [Rhizomicrobium sp.]